MGFPKSLFLFLSFILLALGSLCRAEVLDVAEINANRTILAQTKVIARNSEVRKLETTWNEIVESGQSGHAPASVRLNDLFDLAKTIEGLIKDNKSNQVTRVIDSVAWKSDVEYSKANYLRSAHTDTFINFSGGNYGNAAAPDEMNDQAEKYAALVASHSRKAAPGILAHVIRTSDNRLLVIHFMPKNP